jgi:hypothetical protein
MEGTAPEPDTVDDDRLPPSAAPGRPGPALLRIGDDERAACATALAGAVATGHLSLAEYDDRLSRALSAVTAAEITGLLHDLPTTSARREPQTAPPHRVPVVALRVAIFQFLLVLLAFVLGVDLESELRSAFTISWEIWLVGTLSGAAGYLIAHRSPSAP